MIIIKVIGGSLQEKNGIYQAVFSLNGKRVWRSTGIPVKRGNKRKAEERMVEIALAIDDNPHILDKTDFVEFIDAWLRSAQNQLDEVTYEGYKSYANKHIKPYFNTKKLTLQNIKMKDIEEYYQYKAVDGRLDGKEGGLSYQSIKRHSVVLNHIFNYAIHNQMIKDNPCQYARIPKTAKKTKKDICFYTPDDCKTLLDITKGTIFHDMVYITFIYGMRRSELMGLKWDAIDFNNDTITIQHTVVLQNKIVAKDKTKNQTSKRIYPLLNDVKSILLRRKAIQEKYQKLLGNRYNRSDYVFTHEDGTCYYPSYPTHTLEKIISKYDLPHINFHGLRHSCASMLILQGWQMKEISDWLGHADIGTTMNIYGHINLEHKRKLGNSLNGVLSV